MKNKIEKPENYEAMSAEEKLAFFESFEFEDNSETIQKLKDSVSAANSEAADWKKKHNARLSAEEKAKAERDEELEMLRAERDELKKSKAISDYTAKLAEIGYEPTLAESMAQALADGDVAKVMDNLTADRKSFKSHVEAELIGRTPKPQTSNGVATTKEEILKIKDPAERQQKIAENIELFR